MTDLIVRITTWVTFDERDALQVSMAILDDGWDCLMERTLPCGPFHELPDRLLELHDDARRWLRSCGYQLSMLDG